MIPLLIKNLPTSVFEGSMIMFNVVAADAAAAPNATSPTTAVTASPRILSPCLRIASSFGEILHLAISAFSQELLSIFSLESE